MWERPLDWLVALSLSKELPHSGSQTQLNARREFHPHPSRSQSDLRYGLQPGQLAQVAAALSLDPHAEGGRNGPHCEHGSTSGPDPHPVDLALLERSRTL